jgi:hypothetical protein
MIASLRTAIETLVAECVDDMPPASRQRLAALVVGVMLAGTVVMRQVATTLRDVDGGTVQAASHERRLRRTLNDSHVEAVPTYTRVVRRILQRLRPGQTVRVIIDESGHSDVVRVLVVALWYRGRAIPLTWVLWPAHQPHDQSYWADCTTLLDQIGELLPAGVRITVIGDRAFGCPAFTDLVTARGWHYLVRVQGQTRLRTADGSETPLRDLLTQPGQRRCVRGQVFKKQGWRDASVVAYWRTTCREPLLLVSSLPPQWGLVNEYRLRSAIEALFRDWKASGWQWESSQVRDVDHQAVLVLVLALATGITLCLGEEAAQELLAEPPQAGQRRPWAARDSLFRLGRDRLWQRIWSGDTRPLTWELTAVDAPTWSMECWRTARQAAPPVYENDRVGRREHRRKAA